MTTSERINAAPTTLAVKRQMLDLLAGVATAVSINAAPITLAHKRAMLAVLDRSATARSLNAMPLPVIDRRMLIEILEGLAPVPDPTPAVTWDAGAASANIALSGGNLTATDSDASSANYEGVVGTTSRSAGKRAFEVTCVAVHAPQTADELIGVATAAVNYSDFSGMWGVACNGDTYVDGAYIASLTGQTLGAGDVRGIYVDIDAGKGWVSVNGVVDGDPSAGTDPSFTFPAGSTVFPALIVGWHNDAFTLNAGASDFAYTPPSGFSSWETA